MAFTQSDIDKLDATIKSGTNRVRFTDREVVSRSLDEQLKARALASALVAQENGTLIRQRRIYTSKGM